MSTYEEFMIIINVAALIVAILTYVKHSNKGTKKITTPPTKWYGYFKKVNY